MNLGSVFHHSIHHAASAHSQGIDSDTPASITKSGQPSGLIVSLMNEESPSLGEPVCPVYMVAARLENSRFPTPMLQTLKPRRIQKLACAFSCAFEGTFMIKVPISGKYEIRTLPSRLRFLSMNLKSRSLTCLREIRCFNSSNFDSTSSARPSRFLKVPGGYRAVKASAEDENSMISVEWAIVLAERKW